jgi:hypothetical protein
MAAPGNALKRLGFLSRFGENSKTFTYHGWNVRNGDLNFFFFFILNNSRSEKP